MNIYIKCDMCSANGVRKAEYDVRQAKIYIYSVHRFRPNGDRIDQWLSSGVGMGKIKVRQGKTMKAENYEICQIRTKKRTTCLSKAPSRRNDLILLLHQRHFLLPHHRHPSTPLSPNTLILRQQPFAVGSTVPGDVKERLGNAGMGESQARGEGGHVGDGHIGMG